MAKNQDEPPKISQVSHGANSPNIVGSHNSVTSLTVNHERRLSDEQRDLLVTLLMPFAGTDGSHLIDSMFGNVESTRFAMDFVDVFRRAGWNLPGNGFSQSLYTQTHFGLKIGVHSPADRPPALSALLDGLALIGIESQGYVHPDVTPGEFRIIVCHRP